MTHNRQKFRSKLMRCCFKQSPPLVLLWVQEVQIRVPLQENKQQQWTHLKVCELCQILPFWWGNKVRSWLNLEKWIWHVVSPLHFSRVTEWNLLKLMKYADTFFLTLCWQFRDSTQHETLYNTFTMAPHSGEAWAVQATQWSQLPALTAPLVWSRSHGHRSLLPWSAGYSLGFRRRVQRAADEHF